MVSRRFCFLVLALAALTTLTGCGNPHKGPAATEVNTEEGVQIGDLADLPELVPAQVEGYGIVAGLGQNGSAECPVDVLEYLKRYTRIMMPDIKGNPEDFIRSLDTAVVKVTGEIKPGTVKGGRFDVAVKPIQGSQTRSLAGGQLYTMEMRPPGKALGGGEVLANAGGPIFIDPIAPVRDNRSGYVLSGGAAEQDYPLLLRLKKADYRMVAALRNRVIQRFGPETATAQNEDILTLMPPQKFAGRQREFVTLVKALYIIESDELNKRRIEILTKRLEDGQDIPRTEAALIGIGRLAAPEVGKLTASSNEEVRLHAAKIMLSYREYRALEPLRAILYDTKSKFRMDALRAISEWAPDEQTGGILSRLVNDEDMPLRLAAEDELLRCHSPLVERMNVGGKFFLELVTCKGPSLIYVTRSGAPRIIIFGRDMAVNGDVFITAADGSLTITSEITSNMVTIIRSRRAETGVVGRPLESSRLVADVVRTMSSSPELEGEKVKLTGLNIAYSDTLEAVKTLCDKGCIKATFVAGPMGVTATSVDR
jgi:flagellar basal body P-ring protein FlgI